MKIIYIINASSRKVVVDMINRFIDGIEVIVSDADHYLQINDISGSDLIKIWEVIKNDYTLYEKWICYHNYTEIPYAVLEEIGAALEDDSIETRLNADDFVYTEVFGVVRIKEENFDEFAAYHHKCNPDSGAKPERILRNFSRWGIFVLLSNNKITDYLILSMGNTLQAEIFCVEATDIIKCEKLITFAAKFAFDNGKKEVLYMADENTFAHKTALSVGFVNTGFYKGYEIKRSK
jgi:hypothetical protein